MTTVQTQTGEFRLADASDANYTGLQAPATQAGPVTYTLPPVPASTGLTLTSTTGGVMSWQAASGLALGAVGASPNANGALLTGNTLVLEPASASFPGAVTTGAQTLAGTKTFTSPLQLKDTGDANVMALQAPSTSLFPTPTYTLPTAPTVGTNQFLTTTAGGVLTWSVFAGDQSNAVITISGIPANGSTSNFTTSGITPKWCAATSINGVGSGGLTAEVGQSYGYCDSTGANGCVVLFTHISNSLLRRGIAGNLIYIDSDTATPLTGTVTNFSANNISITWSNPSSKSVLCTLQVHAT
jgi:hypothetical protein